MKALSLAIAAALALTVVPAFAQSASHEAQQRIFTQPLGPIGLDGAPPSPKCRLSLGGERHIHCLHNVVWHGGMYYIDDVTDPAKPLLYVNGPGREAKPL